MSESSAPLPEELKKIDRSAIDDLVKIKQEEDVLKERLAKMEASKQSVSPVVYERVKNDYGTRLETLERNAQPLREVARREYAKLRALDEQYRKTLQDVTLEKEEIEFRQQLGEFSEEDFRSRVAEFDVRLREHQSRLDASTEMKTEFLRAFPSAADLERAAPPPPAAPPKPAVAPAPAAPTPSPVTTQPQAQPQPSPAPSPAATPAQTAQPAPAAPAVQTAPPAPAPAPPAPAPVQATPPGVSQAAAAAGVHEDATVVASPSAAAAPVAPLPPQGGVSTKTTEGGGSTVIFSMPKLVALMNGAPAEEYVLSPKTTIGRTSKNDIQVLEDSVSRQHCEVILATDGYKIVDLGSHNGLSVNGQKVTERLLSDGDVIQIGTRQFVFRG